MAQRARQGRKAQTARPGERVSLGLKVTPEIKNKLDAAAKANGRTQSQEAEARIEQTFRGEHYLEQAMELAYGPRLSVLLLLLGRAMNEIGKSAPFPTDWMDQPHIFYQASAAVGEALEAFRPNGGTPPSPIVAPMIIRKLLAAIKNPEGAAELKDWATPLHDKLGEAAKSLRVEEWVQILEESPGKFTMREGNR